ncbi:hypothetical protein M2191_004496 [Bradyrhizobium japonicum]|nr:hypothetical protein [Bradyrhizobium japonicum]
MCCSAAAHPRRRLVKDTWPQFLAPQAPGAFQLGLPQIRATARALDPGIAPKSASRFLDAVIEAKRPRVAEALQPANLSTGAATVLMNRRGCGSKPNSGPSVGAVRETPQQESRNLRHLLRIEGPRSRFLAAYTAAFIVVIASVIAAVPTGILLVKYIVLGQNYPGLIGMNFHKEGREEFVGGSSLPIGARRSATSESSSTDKSTNFTSTSGSLPITVMPSSPG